MRYDKQGRELPDPTPIEVPAGFGRPLTLQEQIERCFRTIVSRNAEARGHESFEDANDFETDDPDPTEGDTRYTDMGVDTVDGQGRDASAGTGTRARPAAKQPEEGSSDPEESGTPAEKAGSGSRDQRVRGQPAKGTLGGKPTPRQTAGEGSQGD